MTHLSDSLILRIGRKLAWLLVLSAPSFADAQQLAPDSTISRLAWGSVNVLVQSDTTNGVLVWAETSPLSQKEKDMRFAASFDPKAVDPWLDYAQLVVAASKVPRDSDIGLATPPLVARDGSRLILMRRRVKDRWEPHTKILLMDRDQKQAWYIDVGRDDAKQFINTFFRLSGRSRQVALSTEVHDVNPLASWACPQPVAGTLTLRYPEILRERGVSGEVWLEFVIGADGAAQSSSFRVLLSDDQEFSRAAIEAVRHGRFHPATLNGKPINARVHERFTFRIR